MSVARRRPQQHPSALESSDPMTAAMVLARMPIAALAVLLIAGCQGGVPRPGKPTAAAAPQRSLAVRACDLSQCDEPGSVGTSVGA